MKHMQMKTCLSYDKAIKAQTRIQATRTEGCSISFWVNYSNAEAIMSPFGPSFQFPGAIQRVYNAEMIAHQRVAIRRVKE